MPTSTVTYDQVPAVRPTVDDMGGAAKKNGLLRPPDPVRSVTAEDWNQMTQQVAALARVAPVAILTINWVGTSPVIEQVAGMGTAARTASTYTLVGNTSAFTVNWPAATFPGNVCRAFARLASRMGGSVTGSAATVAMTNGVQIYIYDDSGGSTSPPPPLLVLYIYGQ